MERSASINVRVESDVKERAEAIFGELGLSTASAVNAFLRQVVMHRGMPFDMRVVQRPRSLAEMSPEELDAELAKGLAAIEEGRTYSEAEVEAIFRKRTRA